MLLKGFRSIIFSNVLRNAFEMLSLQRMVQKHLNGMERSRKPARHVDLTREASGNLQKSINTGLLSGFVSYKSDSERITTSKRENEKFLSQYFKRISKEVEVEKQIKVKNACNWN